MSSIHPGQWRLSRVEVLNWGTFQGHKTLPIAREGFLITGSSGSGKSSLLDAMSAVLTPRNKLRFNAAANDGGGRRNERTLVSYIRGAWRRAVDDESGEIVSEHLRPGATFSGVLLRYDGGERPVLLVKLYYLRRGASAPADVSELSLLLREEVRLTDFTAYLKSGIDVRRIKSEWPDAFVTDKHSRFSARFSRLLGLSGEAALLLLQKTQAAKQLGSLDDLFRNFMLDEPGTFAIAQNAVDQFAELSQAHAAVVEARQQLAYLERMAVPARAYDEHTAAGHHAQELYDAITPFKNAWKLDLARDQRTTAAEAVLAAERALQAAETAERTAEDAHADARDLLRARGGAHLETARGHVDLAQEQLEHTRSGYAELAQRLASVGVTAPATAEEFAELQATALDEIHTAEQQLARAQQEQYALHNERYEAGTRLKILQADVEALTRQRSNIDRGLLAAREAICVATGLQPASLRFAGELIDVRAEFTDWTGAIERVLRPLSTVMLVPRTHLGTVRRAVDGLHIGARLQFEDVPPASQVGLPAPAQSQDSVINRITVADSPVSAWLRRKLSTDFDYACVETADELSTHHRAVTRAGQIKRSRTRYEKDDRHRVDDRRNWVLGSDTDAKLEHLLEELKAAKAAVEAAGSALERFTTQQEMVRRRRDVLEHVSALRWERVDVVAAEERLAGLNEQLERLLTGSDDLRAAQATEREARLRYDAAKQETDNRRGERTRATAHLNSLDEIIATLEDSEGRTEVAEELQGELRQRFLDSSQRRRLDTASIDDVALRVSQDLQRQTRDHHDTARQAEVEFAGLAHDFATAWKAVAANLEPTITDRAGFAEIRERLAADGLPRFEDRFHELLQNQSQQNIAQLRSEIRQAVPAVRERIAPVNESLARSPFDEGRYLRIKVQENYSERARTFLADLNTISTGSWEMEDRAAAEERFGLMREIMTKLASSDPQDANWRRLCLDTRQHVRFNALEIDGAGHTVNYHESSAGLSGGQQQKLVMFCLAAALRYQLTHDEALVPTYGTVVMDEAFDKADSRFTAMAMDVFQEFGFHMVLATPLKLLQTLAPYIGGTAVVTCRDYKDSRLATLEHSPSAEELAEEELTEEKSPPEVSAPDSVTETMF